MNNLLLGVGSKVEVEMDNFRGCLMIIGVLVKDDEGTLYDYMGVKFPDGYSEKNGSICFNHRDITEIN